MYWRHRIRHDTALDVTKPVEALLMCCFFPPFFHHSVQSSARFNIYLNNSWVYQGNIKMAHLITGNKFDPNKDIPDLNGKVCSAKPVWYSHVDGFVQGIYSHRRHGGHWIWHCCAPSATCGVENHYTFSKGRTCRWSDWKAQGIWRYEQGAMDPMRSERPQTDR